ncbi:MAG: hypothetical protein WB992_11480 [Bryobacteraceae bacterium]
MRDKNFKKMIVVFAALGFVGISLAQTPQAATSPSPSPAAPAAPAASSGSYSIESEIFAYKSLRTNSIAISSEVASLLGIAKGGRADAQTPGVVVVPSISAILPTFQVWRSNVLVLQTFIRQSHAVLEGSNGCPVILSAASELPNFPTDVTAVSQGVAVIQSILALFSTSQSVNEFTGTIQDQALISAVGRKLRARNVKILIPDVLAPWTIANIGEDNFPFIALVAKLIDAHSKLQDSYQCNQLAVTAGSQLQQAETAREKDYAKLAGSSLKPAEIQGVVDDIRAQKAQIDFLRPRIGLSAADMTAIQNDENTITAAGRTLADVTSVAAAKADALKAIRSRDADISSHENPTIIKVTLKAAKVQSLVNGIEAYLAGLTGGAVNFTAPAASSVPSPATLSSLGTQTPAPTATPAGTSAAGPTPAVSSANSGTPPIITILQVDGLARQMGFRINDPDASGSDKPSLGFDNLNAWRILWLKSMESGGAIITETSIFGSHPRFGGGAVSAYALFTLDGALVCSGNAAAYGGYVKAKDFTRNANVEPVAMLEIAGACSADKP